MAKFGEKTRHSQMSELDEDDHTNYLTNARHAALVLAANLHIPEIHVLAGTRHSADVLADLNSLISDATLLDTTDIQFKTGALHTAAEHHSGGSLALTLTSIDSLACRIKTGTYTGDGSESQAIDGLGFAPKWVMIFRYTEAQLGDSLTNSWETIDTQGTGFAMRFSGYNYLANQIPSLDSDGFTVDDAGADAHPNTNNQVYIYVAIG